MDHRKYEPLRVLGTGAYGCAILVRHAESKTAYVAKEIHLKKISERDVKEALNEVRVLEQLYHPNITKLVESFQVDTRLFIVMEYADGGDLAQRICRQRAVGYFTEDAILTYFIQICLALKHLHQKRILHRDIKSLNIFLTSGDMVKLGDFGVSKQVGTIGMANTVCGTFCYFSPEMCRREPYSSKSDVFALGVVLYEMATLGNRPFQGRDVASLLSAITRGDSIPLPSSLPYSESFRELCDWLLTHCQDKRPNITTVLASQYMQDNLRVFAERSLQKEQLFRQRAAEVSSPSISPTSSASSSPDASLSTKKKLGARILDKVFRRSGNSGVSSPTTCRTQQAGSANTGVRMNKEDVAKLLQQPPPAEYKAELAALEAKKAAQGNAPDRSPLGKLGCRENLEATIRDCRELVQLAGEPQQGQDDPIYDGELSRDLQPSELCEFLRSQIGGELLDQCCRLYRETTEEADFSARLMALLPPEHHHLGLALQEHCANAVLLSSK